MADFMDMTGRVFGRVTVLHRVFPNDNTGGVRWMCKCSCPKGTMWPVNGKSLRAGYTKGCGCNPRSNRKADYHCLYVNLVKTARHEQHEVGITFTDFVEYTKLDRCHYCGGKLKWAKHRRDENGFSGYNLDRKNPALGYTADNIVPCCGRCNMAKGRRFTYEEWVEIGKVIATFQERKVCVI